jgi:Uma2 family endonuclease
MAMNAPAQGRAPVMTGLTWQDFLELPGLHRHADLVDGELFVTAPTLLHQWVMRRLYLALIAWTDGGDGRGEVIHEPAVQVAHDRGYMPDLAWWRQEKCAPLGQPPAYDGAPDLVVEVLSPSTRSLVLIRKRADYLRIGTTELWFIDPDQPSAHIVRAGPDGEQVLDLAATDCLRSPMLDGLTVEVGSLIRR